MVSQLSIRFDKAQRGRPESVPRVLGLPQVCQGTWLQCKFVVLINCRGIPSVGSVHLWLVQLVPRLHYAAADELGSVAYLFFPF